MHPKWPERFSDEIGERRMEVEPPLAFIQWMVVHARMYYPELGDERVVRQALYESMFVHEFVPPRVLPQFPGYRFWSVARVVHAVGRGSAAGTQVKIVASAVGTPYYRLSSAAGKQVRCVLTDLADMLGDPPPKDENDEW